MLAGCSSSTLLSPRHRLRSEGSAQFQASHFSMSTQRLDLPCTSFPRKDTTTTTTTRSSQQSLPVIVDSKPKPKCSLKQNIRLPPLATTTTTTASKGKTLKRLAEQLDHDHDDEYESFSTNRAKRTKGIISNSDIAIAISTQSRE